MTGRIDIHEDDFPNHVRQMHLKRDNTFEMEFKVCIHFPSDICFSIIHGLFIVSR